MEAIGERHFLIYAWILWKRGDTIAVWILCKIEVTTGDKSAFFHFMPHSLFLAGENGLAFHTENYAPPNECILDLGCTRAMGSRKAVEAFCRYVDIYYMYIICILYVYYMYIICILYVHYVHVIPLHVYHKHSVLYIFAYYTNIF